MDPERLTRAVQALVELVARLRDPGGCPWDAKQTDSTIKLYLLEEVYEVLDAIEKSSPPDVCQELGDLLFSIVNLARWHKIQPDMALRQANKRFRDRFHLVEEDFKSRDVPMKDAGIEALEVSWQAAKKKLS